VEKCYNFLHFPKLFQINQNIKINSFIFPKEFYLIKKLILYPCIFNLDPPGFNLHPTTANQFFLAMGVVTPPMPSVGSGKEGLINLLLPTVM